jgi:radical SAM-linked protein
MKKQRIRITFSKTEAMRFTGHLDLILTWERTFRRANLPLSYSEGFNPRPVINLAAPLPLGFISSAEIGDFWLSEYLNPDEVLESLSRSLPPGLVIHDLCEIAQLHGRKLPSLIERSEYSVTLFDEYPRLQKEIEGLLQTSQCIRTRKKKEYDLRPLIHDIALESNTEGSPPSLFISLLTLPSATGRPDEVLLALDIPPYETIICRSALILKQIKES